MRAGVGENVSPLTHQIIESATQRGVIDGGIRYMPTRRPFFWNATSFSVSEQWASALLRHTDEYRIFWCGPANDRDHIKW